MTLAPVFVFPGQGSQKVGMAGDFLNSRSNLVERFFARASRLCGIDLFALCQEGPEEVLALTANAQPAILTLSVVAYHLFTEQSGILPSVVAGHSLGEYSALVASGCLDFDDAVRVVRHRGELMQKAVPLGTGTMIALVGIPPDQVLDMTKELSTIGPVEIANLNSSDQTVLSLACSMKEMVLEESRRRGAKRSVELKVSAPFHSSFMREASRAFADFIQSVPFKKPVFRFICNVDGNEATDPGLIRELLVRQMYSPVQWKTIMDRLFREGYRDYYEIGPGKVLTRLIKREYPETVVCSIDSMQAIERSVSGEEGG
ncbi:MAG TPA: ACP S-malonyltransferase [Atribacteraceae bacterium]|nr:ACP S-malonyltransferase [Atribacteraceae bacterium]